jgi:pimeloyl-ACP methyl ester carboxylesterase
MSHNIIKALYFGFIAVPVALIITSTGIAAILQYTTLRRRRKYPPGPGKKHVIEVDYTRFTSSKKQIISLQQFYYTHIRPTSLSRPITIIFEAGNTFNSSTFYHLQRKLQDLGIPTFSYDRVGYGFSSTRANRRLSRSAEIIAYELRCLLDDIGIQPPFIICGHSFGGIYARYFAAENTEDVVGVVLADSGNVLFGCNSIILKWIFD